MRVNSTQIRYSNSPPENLIKWDSSYFYANAMQNASFEFDFINHVYVFTKYVFKGINDSCSPYKWVVEGSLDHVNYKTLHVVNRSLCNENAFNKICYEEFQMSRVTKVRYVKVVNTGGECGGSWRYFGISSADFYGSIVISPIPNMNFYLMHCMYVLIFVITS